jgi:hypothetical protein
MMLRSYAVVAALLISTSIACADGARHVDGTIVRDSAGIEIVENGPEATTRDLGRMLDEPAGRNVEGLELTRVTAALLLADERIVLTDDPARQLVFVDVPSGSRTAVGRRGPGPEEFESLRAMWRCAGDTLVIRGGVLGLKVYDSGGRFVRMSPATRMRSAAVGVSTDCSSVLIHIPNIQSEDVPNDSATLAWYDVTRDSITEIVDVAMQDRQVIPYLGERFAVAVPFGTAPAIATGGDRLFMARSDSPEVRVYDRGGQLVRIIRWKADPEPLTEQDRSRYESVRLDLDERVRPGTTNQVPTLADFRLPASKPIFSRLLVDDDGRLWVRKYPPGYEGFERAYGTAFADAEQAWWIFSPSGQLLGLGAMPRDVVIKDVRGGKVVGLRLDDDDVPHIWVAPLRAPALATESR